MTFYCNCGEREDGVVSCDPRWYCRTGRGVGSPDTIACVVMLRLSYLQKHYRRPHALCIVGWDRHTVRLFSWHVFAGRYLIRKLERPKLETRCGALRSKAATPLGDRWSGRSSHLYVIEQLKRLQVTSKPLGLSLGSYDMCAGSCGPEHPGRQECM